MFSFAMVLRCRAKQQKQQRMRAKSQNTESTRFRVDTYRKIKTINCKVDLNKSKYESNRQIKLQYS